MENVYEGMFIFDSTRYAREPGALPGQLDELIRSAGGEMLASRLWEERRLAYPIKGHRKGTYWLTYFRVDAEQLGGLNRQCQINDAILRHLFLKVDPRLVDTLVTHAREGHLRPAEEAEEEKAKVPVGAALEEDEEEVGEVEVGEVEEET